MTFPSWRRNRFAFAVAAGTLAAAAGVMTAVFARPVSVASDVLGADWQCQRIVWVTSCTHVQPEVPAAKIRQKEPVARSPV
jgi:hypothetical protein